MDFLQDYWTYHSCYEIPRNYALWSAVSLIGAALHRRIYYTKGDLEIHSADYCLLVGPMGNKKSTCCDFAEKLLQTTCPNIPIGASNQSVEDIVRNMASDKFERVYTNERDEKVTVRPYAFFIGEFKNFIAYNPIRMVNFLTDIYHRKFYSSGTILRNSELVMNPSLNILACENPDQLVRFMKNDIITGGMARRVVIVYEPDYAPPIPRPIITPDAAAAWNRVRDRLIVASSLCGKYQETPSGNKFFDSWYMQNHARMKVELNPVVKGYLSTKDDHLLKTAMKIDIVSDKPMFCFTDELMQHSCFMLDAIEANMPRITAVAGRNDMMPAQIRALDLLKNSGGWLPEKQLKRELERDLSPLELHSVLRHLEDTEQIFRRDAEVPTSDQKMVKKSVILLPEFYQAVKNGEAVLKL